MKRLQRLSGCKLNLILNILGKRSDGFHELETVMHPLGLYDTLTFELSENAGIGLASNHPSLPVDSTNLVYKAAVAFQQATGQMHGVQIQLEKKIPLAAGLGGGSGNAAATLLALNELFGTPLEPERLQTIAASLGSDVPFFLQSAPALALGRGEQITPLAPVECLEGVYAFLIHPGFGVSTAWAYQALSGFPAALHGQKGRAQRLIASLKARGLKAAEQFYNSLEAPVLQKHPLLRLFQEFLRQHGAVAALMSGSGSTTFALVENRAAGVNLGKQWEEKFGDTYWTALLPLASAGD